MYHSYKQVHLQTLILMLYLIPLLGYGQQYRDANIEIRKNTHDWNNDKPYEGDLQILNGK